MESSPNGSGVIQSQIIASEPDFVTSKPSKTFKNLHKTLFLTCVEVIYHFDDESG